MNPNIRRSKNKWTIQLIPHGVGKPRQWNIYYYPLSTLAVLMTIIFISSISLSYVWWQQTEEKSGRIDHLLQYVEENQHLQQVITELEQEMSAMEQEIDSLYQSLLGMEQLEQNIALLDGELSAIPHYDRERVREVLKAQDEPEHDSMNDRSVAIASVRVDEEDHPPSLSTKLQTIHQRLEDMLRFTDEQIESFEQLKLELNEFYEEAQYIPSIRPSEGRISSPFGMRRDPISRVNRMHEGIDFAHHRGTPIHATANGTVVFAGRDGGHGNRVIIDHGNAYRTSYSHLLDMQVEVGDRVEKGQPIARMGSTDRSTGVHLHYEVHRNGTPVNPMRYIEGGQ